MALPSIIFEYFKEQVHVGAKVTPKNPSNFAWVTVTLLTESSYRLSLAKRSDKYLFRYIEVDERFFELRGRGYDLSYEDAVEYEEIFAKTDGELEQILQKWMTDLNVLGPPWRFNSPI